MLKPEVKLIDGPVGKLETIFIPAKNSSKGVAVICHPNPLEGGTNNNKIVQTVAKTFSEQGYDCFCPNMRGVGGSEGVHDYGRGEVDDILATIEYAKKYAQTDQFILAGFSFGAYVSLFVANKLLPERLLLIGTAVGRYEIPAPDIFDIEKTFVIHGEKDDVIALENVFDWARPQGLPVMVLPGAEHFFHGQLIKLKQILIRYFNLPDKL